MKKITLATLVGIAGLGLIGCSPAANTTTANVKTTNLNSNTAVVVNSNSAMGVNANMGMNSNMGASMSNRYNSTMTREEYNKNEADYKADQTGSTIGQGADDKWIWFKTKAALTTTNDLRDSTINVDVVNGVITLKGSVASKAEADKAVAAAKGIEGQKGIKNELKVNANDSMTNQMSGGGMTDGDRRGNMNANMKH